MAAVNLHVYDVSVMPEIEKLNQVLTAVGTGAFHAAIEVHGKEYSYGFSPSGTGIFIGEPKKCQMHHYRESVSLGETKLATADVAALVKRLEPMWPGSDYDHIRCNSVVFCTAFAKELGANELPAWVGNLAGAGATIQDGAMQAASAAQATAIMAAAKAGELEDKYKITGTVTAKVTDLLGAAKEMDEQHKIIEQAQAAAKKGGDMATKAAADATAKAKELEQKHGIFAKVTAAAAQGGAMATQAADDATVKAKELSEQHKIVEKATAAAQRGSEMAAQGAASATAKAQELDDKHHIREQAAAGTQKAIFKVQEAADKRTQ